MKNKKILSFLLVFSFALILCVANVFAAPEPIEMQYDDHLELEGTITINDGDTIVELDANGKLHAKGVGTTTIKVDDTDVDVTVGKAKLNVVLIAGQSNAAGVHGGRGGVDAICPETGYGYYWNGSSMQDLKSYISTISSSIGFYPALAYEWYELTGEKVLIMKHTYSGNPISTWAAYADGTLNNGTTATVNTITSCLNGIDTTKYEVVRKGYYWLQGETDAFTSTTGENSIYPTATQYATAYKAMHNAFIEALGEGSYGAIMSCRTRYNIGSYEAIEYCGMRVAQQDLANQNSDIYMASVITDDWYEAGNVSYTSLSNVTVSGTAAEMGANNIHYNQKGYNILGLDAADNMYNALVVTPKPTITDIKLIGHNGYTTYANGATIDVQDNLRYTGNYNAFEANMAQIVARPLPVSATCSSVTMTLKHENGDVATGIMDNRGYIDTTKVTEPLTLVVTAGNVTKTYTLINSDNESGSTIPSGNKYYWDFSGDTPISISGEGWTENKLTSDLSCYKMESEVTLKNDEPWTIEWNGAVTKQSIVLSKAPGKTEGNHYVYIAPDVDGDGNGSTFGFVLVKGGPGTSVTNQVCLLKDLTLDMVNDQNNIWYVTYDGNGTITLALKHENQIYKAEASYNNDITFTHLQGAYSAGDVAFNYKNMDYLKIYRTVADLTVESDGNDETIQPGTGEYYWDFSGDTPISISGEGWTENTLTAVSNYWKMTDEVTFKADETWTIEWKGSVTGKGVVFSKYPGNTSGNHYFYITDDQDSVNDSNIYGFYFVKGGNANANRIIALENLPLNVLSDVNTKWYVYNDGTGKLTVLVIAGNNRYTAESTITAEFSFDHIKGAYGTGTSALAYQGDLEYVKIYRDVPNFEEKEIILGTVSIQGNTDVGSTLTADISKVTYSGDIKYQWYSDDEVISNAINSTYVVQNSDLGKKIKVVVYSTGSEGTLESNSIKIGVENYWWTFNGSTYTSISGDDWTENLLTSDLSCYKMEQEVTLKHDKPWTVEWKGAISKNTVVLSKAPGQTVGNHYVYVSNDVDADNNSSTYGFGLLGGGNVTSADKLGVLKELTSSMVNDSTNVWYITNDGSGKLTIALKNGDTIYKSQSTISEDLTFTHIQGSFGGNYSQLNYTYTPGMEYMKIYNTATKFPMEGSVSISGIAEYDETLSVDVSELTYTGTLSYQWYREDAEIENATNSTYKLTADDIDKNIKVEVSSSGNSGSLFSDTVGPVTGSVIEKYTVTWKDESGDVLETDTEVEYGTVPSYDGETPTKAATAEYTYTFEGWTPAVEEVTGDATYTATYTSVKNKYTVTWKDESGDVLETDTEVEYGVTPSYDGETPTKAATAEYTYTFEGWTPAIETVTGEATYIATYTETQVTPIIPTTYTVTFNTDGGSAVTEQTIEEGQKATRPTTNPTKTGYTFAGWYTSSEFTTEFDFDTVITTDTEIFAKWTKNQSFGGGGSSTVTKYTITVKQNENGAISPETIKVTKGQNQKFMIKANDGYEIEAVKIDGVSIGIVTEYTFENVKAKHTIEATFKKVEEVVEETWKNPFTDVSEKDWFYESVKYANENGIMNGMTENTFDPSYNMTRGMLVTVLYRLENEPATNKSIPFADVDLSMYYGNAVIWAKQNNIVNGMDENNFMPNASITREQLTTILYRYAKYKGMDVSVGEDTNILSYDDFNELSEYAMSATQWACGSGIINGRTEATLVPKGTATRAEVATMIMRFVK